MKHIGLAILVVVGLTAGSGLADTYFEDHIATAGEYLWGTNLNWNPVGATDSSTEARIGLWDDAGDDAPVAPPLAAVMNTSQIVRNLHIAGESSLTVNAGTLDIVHDPAEGPWGMLSIGASGPDTGVEGAGTLNLNGGVINANTGDDAGVHGVVHIARYADGTLNQTGGTLNVLGESIAPWGTRGTVGCVAISAMGATGRGVYNMSGGVLNTYIVLAGHNGATMGSEFNISGDAVVNVLGTQYNNGIMLHDGGTLTVTGGNASISVVEEMQLGGPFNNAGVFTLAFEIDATGVSTINTKNLIARGMPSQTNNLVLSGAGATSGTYTLFHTVNDPSVGVGVLTMSGAGFSNLQVVDLTATTGGYDIRVDFAGSVIMGDVNLSGLVDDDDLSLLLANWNIGDEWGEGDLNDSGNVDDDDLSLLLANWGAGGSAAPQAVPEPATLVMLALGGLALVRRGRR